MKKILSLLLSTLLITAFAKAQDKYYTKTGKISFDATATNSPENVDAVNKNVICVLDTKTGNFQFSVLMTGFEFQRALMQEHFNENYVESGKYPKAEFKGIVTDNASVNYARDGIYPVKVKGKLSIHGETKEVESLGKMEIKAGKIIATSEFTINLSDYKISVPNVVADKLSPIAKIKVNCTMEPLKQ
jgi:YceI-like domain